MIDRQRSDVARFNPLVGVSTTDTIENLKLCLCQMGGTFSEKHQDETIGFFCSVVAAALDFESEQIKAQLPIRTVGPERLASNSR